MKRKAAQQSAPSDVDVIDTPSHIDHRKLPRGPSEKASYTEEQKTLALAVYAETGSLQTASEQARIPRNTIRYWVENDPEIDATLDAFRQAIRQRAAFIVAEIAVRSAEELLDRVNNGDYHVDKKGVTTRRPLPGRELAFIASVSIDKHALLTGSMGRNAKRDATLEAIATKLDALVDGRKRAAQTYPQAVDAENA